uniref:Putative clathrin assembly protein At2g25430 n=1 Tax=Tanacetum cinerariifolium TaxID=118510 RepID=A0A6L2M9Z4_TANCI|nr:putative clathrin assembly protein At2g25430 [Tanacetum cinerariifolium]
MSSSTIRKAIGVVKDQIDISIAKGAGNVAPDLKVLIVKATGHDKEPAEEKYIREILHRISQSRGYVGACVYNISKRLSKTHDWVVALKALRLVHRLLADGDLVFCQEIIPAGSAKSNKMMLVALYLVLRESFRVYADICEALGVLLDRFPEMESSEFPKVQRVTDKILATLERCLREKENKLNKNTKISLIKNGPFIPTETTKDLLDMKDDTEPPANQANTLALALFSWPKTVTTKGSLEVFSVPKKAYDWELALVESASNLSKQNTSVTGGLDPVTLNGIYNQGAVTHQQVSYNQLGDGTYNNIGRTATPVLALPTPHGNYVQLANLEIRKSFLAQEHVWQPYEAMVCQVKHLWERLMLVLQITMA